MSKICNRKSKTQDVSTSKVFGTSAEKWRQELGVHLESLGE